MNMYLLQSTRKPNGFFPSLFDNSAFFSGFLDEGLRPPQRLSWPAIDLVETKGTYVVEADLPGIEEKDIKIEFVDGTLRVEASRQKSVNEENQDERKVHLNERQSWTFRRSFEFGDVVDAEKIHASFKNGTLRIEVPKQERALPKPIQINVARH
ncbi:MAG: Hsp20/alpha crystallin family protein [Bdellovibrionota bacterium]